MKPKFQNQHMAKADYITLSLSAPSLTHTLRLTALVALILGGAATSAHAADLHFDVDTTSGLTAGAATWDVGTTSAWQVSGTPGVAAPGLWADGNVAVFNTTPVGGTNTVTINGAVSAAGLSSGTNGVVTNISGGALTLTGNITVNGTNSSLTIANTTAVTLASNLLVTVNSTPTVTINADITETGGARSLSKATAGLLTLAGNNSYTGGTTLTGGSLALGSANAIGTTGTVTFNGGALRYTAANTADNSARFSNAVSQQYRIETNGQTVTLGTALTSVGGSLTKLTTGTLILTGANTYAGGTTVSAGTLQLSGANDRLSTAGNVTVNGGVAILDLGGNTQTTSGTISFTRGTVQNGTFINNTANYVTNTADGIVVSAVLQGTAGYTKTGTSFLTLSGNNSYSGGTLLTSGTIRLGHVNGLGASTLTFNGGALGLSTSLGTIASAMQANTNVTYSFDTLSHSATVSASLGANGTNALTKASTGTLTLAGTNSFTGATTVSGGVLNLTNALALQNSAYNTTGSVAGTGTAGLRTTATTLTLGGLTGNKNFAATGGVFSTTTGGYSAVTALTLNPGVSENHVYSGVISNGAAGMTLNKTGLGTQTLSGANTYTGATSVSAGTLIVNGNISTSILTTVNSTGAIGGSGTVGALTIATGGTHNPGNSPGIMNTGDYIMAGSLNIEVTGNTPGVGGYDQVNVTGTINLSGALITTFTAGTYANGDLLFILLNDGSDAVSGTFSGLAQNSLVANYGGFNWNISYTANSTGNTFTGGNDVALMAIPEPSVAMLIGLAMLTPLRRRRN